MLYVFIRRVLTLVVVNSCRKVKNITMTIRLCKIIVKLIIVNREDTISLGVYNFLETVTYQKNGVVLKVCLSYRKSLAL